MAKSRGGGSKKSQRIETIKSKISVFLNSIPHLLLVSHLEILAIWFVSTVWPLWKSISGCREWKAVGERDQRLWRRISGWRPLQARDDRWGPHHHEGTGGLVLPSPPAVCCPRHLFFAVSPFTPLLRGRMKYGAQTMPRERICLGSS